MRLRLDELMRLDVAGAQNGHADDYGAHLVPEVMARWRRTCGK